MSTAQAFALAALYLVSFTAIGAALFRGVGFAYVILRTRLDERHAPLRTSSRVRVPR